MRITPLLTKFGTPLVVAAATLAAAGPAMAATTIGSTALPSGATMPVSACTTSSTTEIVPYSTSASYQYAVPSGGGTLTSWSFNTAGATAGTPYTLLVIRPAGTSYEVVGTDAETVPAAKPPIATFTLAKPIAVQGGDLIGAVVTSKSKVGCEFKGSTIPSSNSVGSALHADTVGTTFPLARTIADELVNVSATVTQSNDIAITQAAEPSQIVQGDDGVFVLSVSNTGPSSSAVTVTDTLPSGLSPVSASAGASPCATSGQTVTCTVASAPASIAVVAAASKTGTYTNTATATGTITDSDPANNTATAGLSVSAMPSGTTGVSTDLTGLNAFANPLIRPSSVPAPLASAFFV